MAEQGSQRSARDADDHVTGACPYCGQLTSLKVAPPMPPRLRRLYDAVVIAGESGLPYEDARRRMWGGKERSDTTIRTGLHRINTLLANSRTGTQLITRGKERIFIVRR